MSTRTIDSLCSINPETLAATTAEFRYLDISSVTKGRIDWSTTQLWKYESAPSRARRRLRFGDVLLCTVRPGLQAHARICEQVDFPLVGSTGFAVLRPDLGADSAFIFHQIFSDSVAAQLRALETGSNYPAVNERDVRNVTIFCPEKEERWSIAAALDKIDEAIARAEAVIVKLRQVRAGLLHDLLTRGLDANGQLRNPVKHPEQFQDTMLGRIPREWAALPLGRLLCRIDQGWSPDCDSATTSAGEWGVLKTTAVMWEGYNDAENKRLPASLDPLPAYEVKDGDVLMTRCGPGARVGVVALVNNTQGQLMLSDKLYRLVPRDSINPAFLVLILSSHSVQLRLAAVKTGMAESQTNISYDIVHKLDVALPEPKEQDRVVASMEIPTRQLKAEVQELAKLQVLKSGLMTDLLTGRVRVPEARETVAADYTSVAVRN